MKDKYCTPAFHFSCHSASRVKYEIPVIDYLTIMQLHGGYGLVTKGQMKG